MGDSKHIVKEKKKTPRDYLASIGVEYHQCIDQLYNHQGGLVGEKCFGYAPLKNGGRELNVYYIEITDTTCMIFKYHKGFNF